MYEWNVPLMVFKNIIDIMKIDKIYMQNKSFIKNYEKFKKIKLSNNRKINEILDNIFNLIEDNSIDYHIMNIEKLFLSSYIELSLKDKIKKVYEDNDFECIKEKYNSDINKKKQLLLECIKYVFIKEKDDFILLKYTMELQFYNLWNNFYLECRGLVLDMRNIKVVNSPYKKFFNLNENEYSSLKRIKLASNQAEEIIVRDKLDGSMISISNYQGNPFITTTGSFENSQIEWTKDFLLKKYPYFANNIPCDYTFIFECIYPENKIVVDYGQVNKLILTNIKDNKTGRLLCNNLLEDFANKYQLEIADKEENNSLETLMFLSKDVEKYPSNKKEGWVFRIRTKDEDILFKLKCEDYCKVHKLLSHLTPKNVFNSIIEETLDDIKTQLPKHLLGVISDISSIIFEYINKVNKEISICESLIKNNNLILTEELVKYRELENYLDIKIIPKLDKYSKITKEDIKQNLLKKSCGQESFVELSLNKILNSLWDSIPNELKNQKDYYNKKRIATEYIFKNVDKKYRSLAFNIIYGDTYDKKNYYIYSDIDFSKYIEEIDRIEDTLIDN